MRLLYITVPAGRFQIVAHSQFFFVRAGNTHGHRLWSGRLDLSLAWSAGAMWHRSSMYILGMLLP